MTNKMWLPVKDGYNVVAVTFGGRHTERASVEGDWLTVAWRGEWGDEIKASIQLPADLRLCQLGPEKDDFWIDDDGKCSNCGEQLDFDDMSSFEVEKSGVQPGTPDGPTQYWVTGVWICPSCHERLPFETSS